MSSDRKGHDDGRIPCDRDLATCDWKSAGRWLVGCDLQAPCITAAIYAVPNARRESPTASETNVLAGSFGRAIAIEVKAAPTPIIIMPLRKSFAMLFNLKCP